MNRILLEPCDIRPDGTVLLKGAQAQHVREVLQASAGDSLRLGIVDGPRGRGLIRGFESAGVLLDAEWEPVNDPRPTTSLVLALPRPKVMKRLWAQLAALGVDEIHLIKACKVEKVYWASHVLQESFYRPLLLEGLQQAGCTALPRVRLHRTFKPFVEDVLPHLLPHARRLGAHPYADAHIRSLLDARPKTPVLLAIGPEGGWTDYELAALSQADFIWGHSGTRILRSDTACIALLAMAACPAGELEE